MSGLSQDSDISRNETSSNTTKKSKRSQATIKLPQLTFDEDGDLRLSVGKPGQEQDMIVDPRALRRSSPVFRKMLSDNFKERKPESGEWHVSLPEDNAKCFAIVMSIIHSHFERIPDNLPEAQLWSIAVVTNKYDMTCKVRPKARLWVEQYQTDSRKNSTQSDRTLRSLRSLWIAWEFGHKSLFMSAVLEIAETMLICDNGEIDRRYAKRAEVEQLGCLDIPEKIKEQRIQKLFIIRDECLLLRKDLFQNDQMFSCTCSRPLDINGNSDTIGKFLIKCAKLDIAGLFLTPEKYIRLSMNSKDIINKIQHAGKMCSGRHVSKPIADLLTRVQDKIDKLDSVVTEWHLKQIETQRLKTQCCDKPKTKPKS